MAYNRQIEMNIIQAGTKNLIVTNISNLFIDFDIERTLILSSNKANFTVYNAKEDTRNKILQKNNVVAFKAGHEDEKNLSNIFYGTIGFPCSFKQGTEFVTKFQAYDLASGAFGLEYQFFSFSYKEKTPIIQVFKDVSSLLDVSLFGIENLTQILNNSFNYSGNIGGLLREMRYKIKGDGLEIYLDSGSLVIYKVGNQISKYGVIKMPSKNIIGGIENVEDASRQDNKKRIKFNSILNPKTKPNVLINVEGEYTKGIFTCEKAHFVGNNYGGRFDCEIEAIA